MLKAPEHDTYTQRTSCLSGSSRIGREKAHLWGPVDPRTTGRLTGQKKRNLCVLLGTKKDRVFLLVNWLVVPDPTTCSEGLCVKNLYAFSLPERSCWSIVGIITAFASEAPPTDQKEDKFEHRAMRFWFFVNCFQQMDQPVSSLPHSQFPVARLSAHKALSQCL